MTLRSNELLTVHRASVQHYMCYRYFLNLLIEVAAEKVISLMVETIHPWVL